MKRNPYNITRKSRGQPRDWFKVKRQVHPIVAQLRALRLEQGYTQEALAEIVEIDRATIAYGERGDVQTTLANLSAWAEALGYRIVLKETGE